MLKNPQRLAIRVYYEDTDFSGRVYHASYLRFFERGRSEWLRSIGFSHAAFARLNQTAFAVAGLQVKFRAPAVIDDLIEVETELLPPRGPILHFRQSVWREGAELVAGSVDVVAIRGDRAVRPPREILDALGPVGRSGA